MEATVTLSLIEFERLNKNLKGATQRLADFKSNNNVIHEDEHLKEIRILKDLHNEAVHSLNRRIDYLEGTNQDLNRKVNRLCDDLRDYNRIPKWIRNIWK